MPAWIFQGNPDKFDIDKYLRRTSDITWSVRQKHLATEMRGGDEVFLWRSEGRSKGKSGLIAAGHLVSSPELLDEDEESKDLWIESSPSPALRVRARIDWKASSSREVVDRNWLKSDPQVSDLRILRMANETNYKITPYQAQRLRSLVTNVGRNWNRDESLAGLWAYIHTLNESVTLQGDSPVGIVSVKIGRAIKGVYNKVMNFRAIDPRDKRAGLPAASRTDEEVWAEFYDPDSEVVNIEMLDKEFEGLWGSKSLVRQCYTSFGDAPNDDPTELQTFAAKVRKGQPAFRKNLMTAYDKRCAITGWGPPDVLEAVHIVPHSQSGINALDNGLLIRADLHHLLDLNLLSIDPNTFEIHISDKLKYTEYWQLQGIRLRARIDGSMPEPRFFKERWGV